MLIHQSPSLAGDLEADQDSNLIKVCYLDWGKYGGDNLPNKGIISDIVTQTLEHAGYKVQMDILPWKRCVRNVSIHQYDIVAAAWITQSHSKDFEYMRTISYDSVSFFSLESSKYKSQETLGELLQSLYGEEIGLVKSEGYPDQFMKHKDMYNLTEITRLKQLIKMLLANRIGLIVSDPINVYDTLDELKVNKIGLKVLSPPISISKNSPMISKSHPRKVEIMTRFNAAIEELLESGLHKRIMETHNSPHLKMNSP
jgi:polar amino acid transport system substrate-binding protein